MKIYEIRPCGGYCGGCMLVQANDKQEAMKIASKDDYNIDYVGPDGFSINEILGLHYDVKEPCVIISALYYE